MTLDYLVKNIEAAPSGELKIEWAEKNMPVLMSIRKKLSPKKPLKNIVIGAALHVTKETAALARTLTALGAEVYLAASNPLSTQDDVAAALAKEGIHVYAWRGMDKKSYYEAIARVINAQPHIVMDDGGDLTGLIHKLHYGEGGFEVEVARSIIRKFELRVIGGTEETTTGVIRLRAMAKEGRLLFPVIAVNDSYTKYLFDNRYGAGQSTLDGIMRATNILLAGKTVVVAGYGWVGRGIASRAKGMGAKVIIVEVNPIRALEAYYDGFYVSSMRKAARLGDIFITATGNRDVIRLEHFKLMKDGAILANAGHFNVEISLKDLEKIAVSRRKINPMLEEYKLENGKRLYLLAEGRLVNLACAEGNPSEVMDMSFANQTMAAIYLVKNRGRLKPKVYRLPESIDMKIARLKLSTLGVSIEKLTKRQREYLASWRLGT